MAEIEWSRRTVLAAAGMLAAGAEAQAAAPEPRPTAGDGAIPVAILLGPHATLIDFAGPWEVLGAAAYACPGFNVYSVAASRDPILCDDARTVMGDHKPASAPRLLPDFTFDDAPPPRVLIMGAQLGDEPRKIAWIRDVARRTDLVASVCTGAFLLAKTGLLDGKRATTNRNAYDTFQKTFPKVSLVRGVRFVDNGSTATATGLTAGVDLSLHIVDRFYGRDAAQAVADYEEWSGRAWLV